MPPDARLSRRTYPDASTQDQLAVGLLAHPYNDANEAAAVRGRQDVWVYQTTVHKPEAVGERIDLGSR